jgi:hypothetical protein
MKMTAAAAIGALILAASAAPALAGGYWDGGIVHGGQAADPSPARGDRDCPCYCPRDRADYGDRRDDRRAWSDQRDWSVSDRDDADQQGYDDEDYAPADYSDDSYDSGSGYVIDSGGSGGFVGAGGFVGVDIGFHDRFRDHDQFREHDRFHEHDMRHDHYPPHMMQHDDHPYPQHTGYPHMGSWGSIQPHPTHMIGSYGHTGGYGHPAAHGGGGRHR